MGGVGFDYNRAALGADLTMGRLDLDRDTRVAYLTSSDSVQEDVIKLVQDMVEQKLNNLMDDDEIQDAIDQFANTNNLPSSMLTNMVNGVYETHKDDGMGKNSRLYYVHTGDGKEEVFDGRRGHDTRYYNGSTATNNDINAIESKVTASDRSGMVRNTVGNFSHATWRNQEGNATTGRTGKGSDQVRRQKSGQSTNKKALDKGKK